MLLICYQNGGFGFAIKMTPTGYFFQNCHGFLVGAGATGSGVAGNLDSIIALLVSGCLYARPDVVIRYFCFQAVVLKVQFFVVTVQRIDLF